MMSNIHTGNTSSHGAYSAIMDGGRAGLGVADNGEGIGQPNGDNSHSNKSDTERKSNRGAYSSILNYFSKATAENTNKTNNSAADTDNGLAAPNKRRKTRDNTESPGAVDTAIFETESTMTPTNTIGASMNYFNSSNDTTTANTAAHWNANSAMVPAWTQWVVMETLLPGDRFVTNYGVVEVLADDRNESQYQYPRNIKTLQRKYQGSRDRAKQRKRAQLNTALFQSLLRRRLLSQSFQRREGHPTKEDVLKASHGRVLIFSKPKPWVPPKRPSPRPDPVFHPSCFPDRIVKCRTVPDERGRVYTTDNDGKTVDWPDSKSQKNPQFRSMTLYLRRRLLNRPYDCNQPMYICSKCGQEFVSRDGFIYHEKSVVCRHRERARIAQSSDALKAATDRVKTFLDRTRTAYGSKQRKDVPVYPQVWHSLGFRAPPPTKDFQIPRPGDKEFDLDQPDLVMLNLREELRKAKEKALGPVYLEVWNSLGFSQPKKHKTRPKIEKPKPIVTKRSLGRSRKKRSAPTPTNTNDAHSQDFHSSQTEAGRNRSPSMLPSLGASMNANTITTETHVENPVVVSNADDTVTEQPKKRRRRRKRTPDKSDGDGSNGTGANGDADPGVDAVDVRVNVDVAGLPAAAATGSVASTGTVPIHTHMTVIRKRNEYYYPIIDMQVLLDEVKSGRYPSIKKYTGEHMDECKICKKDGFLYQCDFCSNAVHLRCLEGKMTLKEPEVDDDFMCHNCIQKILSRRNRAEKRRQRKREAVLEKATGSGNERSGNDTDGGEGTSTLAIEDPSSSTDTHQRSQQQPTFESEHHKVAAMGKELSEMAELLDDARARFRQMIETKRLNDIRRAQLGW